MKRVKKALYDNALDIQLALIRIYIGLDFTHHFAEKFGLLGPEAYHGVVQYMAGLGLSPVYAWMAGAIEFAIFLGFTFGLFTRIAAAGGALYLVVSLFFGRHNLSGFTWANHVSAINIHGHVQTVYGGWEFPLLWAFVCLTFVMTGGRKWSVDRYLRKSRFKILQRLSR